jgi:hypothetical protein
MREQDWGLSTGYGEGVSYISDEWPPVISSTEIV